jgi:hypothetical protein
VAKSRSLFVATPPSDRNIEQFGPILNDSKEIFVSLCNVASYESVHPIPVLSDQAFVNLAMIFKVEANPLHIEKVDPALDDELFPGVLKNLTQGHVLACLIEKLVKTETLDGVGGQVSFGQRAPAFVEIGPKLCQIVLCPILKGQECSRNLQQLLNSVNLHDFLHTEFLYKNSLVWNPFDQSIVLEVDDRFTDGGATAVQLLTDHVLANFLAGFQIELQNGLL